MKILTVKLADFDDDDTTVAVTVESETDGAVTFDVQTVDGEHRKDLGCWITTSNYAGDVSYDDYPDVDFQAVINAAELYATDATVLHEIDRKTIGDKYVALLERANTFYVVTENSRFLNADASAYESRYNELARFDNKKSAVDYIAANAN